MKIVERAGEKETGEEERGRRERERERETEERDNTRDKMLLTRACPRRNVRMTLSQVQQWYEKER